MGAFFHHLNLIIKRIALDHHTVVFIGLMLILTGLINLSDHLFVKVFGIAFEVAYGYIFLGVFNIMMAFTFIIMGAANIELGLNEPVDPLETLKARIATLEAEVANLKRQEPKP